MAAGVALAAPARETKELGLGPCGESEHNFSALAVSDEVGQERR